MRRIALYFTTSLAALALCLAGAPISSAALGDQLLGNPGAEDGAISWVGNHWFNQAGPDGQLGTADDLPDYVATFTTPAGGAHSGSASFRVDVSGHQGTQYDGDASWTPDLVAVKGNTYYTFSDWYRSDVNTAISVYYEKVGDTPGEGHWQNLYSAISPASSWTHYETGFTMPAGAYMAQFVHRIAGDGFLQTDDYSLAETTASPGFDTPIISLTFDDGSKADFQNVLPILNAKGYKSTQYIPTNGLSPYTDLFLMNADDIRTTAAQGHEIGSHSITHPDLTTVDATTLKNELAASKSLLENVIGMPVVNFAYPFGAYDDRVITAMKAAGYRSGRSVEDGYNTKLDLEPYDIRDQNMLTTTTQADFESWVSYARDHKYWLVITYHEVLPAATPACVNEDTDPEPCIGPYDTTIAKFQAQMDYISNAGLGGDVKTVQDALDTAAAQTHPIPTPTPTPMQTPTPAPSPISAASLTPAATLLMDTRAPHISIKSPKARRYKVGQTLKISFTCTDSSGVARYKATFGRVGHKARTVKKGTKVHLSRAGTYVLRITATDRKGNTTSTVVRLRVTRR